MSKPLFAKALCALFAFLYLAYLATLLIVPVKPAGFSWGVSSLGLPAFELAFFCVLTLTIWALRGRWTRYFVLLICLTIPVLIAGLYAAQLLALILSGRYLTVLAIENASEAAYIVNKTSISLMSVLVLLLLMVAAAGVSDVIKQRPRRGSFAFVGLALIIAMGALYDHRNKFFSEDHHSKFFSEPVDIGLAPALGLHATFTTLSKMRADLERIAHFEEEVGAGRLEPTFELKARAPYPFQQMGISSDPLPFTIRRPKDAPMNIIVVFMEGVSARMLGEYGGPYEDLMPNLNKFAQSAISIDKYHNHTAATYRGILGALASGFPAAGGVGRWGDEARQSRELSEIPYVTVPSILETRGYETRFFSPHGSAYPFDDFLEIVGFEDVVTKEDVLGEITQLHLSDEEHFANMAAALKNREKSGDKTPFFWGSYNYGSHAFQDAPKAAPKYGDGGNAALNRYHELDRNLKIFLEAFDNSAFAENTLLIVTSDHSAYAEPPVVEAFGGSAKFTQYFIDQIPLLIRVPGADQPERYENGIRTSLDLAPTILHLLGIKDVENAFLGTSLFAKAPRSLVNWAAVGRSIFRIDASGVVNISAKSANPTQADQTAIDTIFYYYYLEGENRLVDQKNRQASIARAED